MLQGKQLATIKQYVITYIVITGPYIAYIVITGPHAYIDLAFV